MICPACKVRKHEHCPKNGRDDEQSLPPTGLSPEGDYIQRSGLCGCLHRDYSSTPFVEMIKSSDEAVNTLRKIPSPILGSK